MLNLFLNKILLIHYSLDFSAQNFDSNFVHVKSVIFYDNGMLVARSWLDSNNYLNDLKAANKIFSMKTVKIEISVDCSKSISIEMQGPNGQDITVLKTLHHCWLQCVIFSCKGTHGFNIVYNNNKSILTC